MKIFKLVYDNLSFPKTEIFTKPEENKLYHNIKIGKFGKNFQRFILYFDKNIFNSDKPINLLDDDYEITTVKNRFGESIIDKNKKQILSITKNKIPEFSKKNDVLLILHIPYDRLTFQNYKLEGNIEKLAEAWDGIEWYDQVYKAPVLLLHITGDCKLSWESKKKDGSILRKEYSYNYKTSDWSGLK